MAPFRSIDSRTLRTHTDEADSQSSTSAEHRLHRIALRLAALQGHKFSRGKSLNSPADRLEIVDKRDFRNFEAGSDNASADFPGKVGELRALLDDGAGHRQAGAFNPLSVFFQEFFEDFRDVAVVIALVEP